LKDSLADKYRKAAEEFALLGSKEERILLYLSVARFFSFAGGVILIWFIYTVSPVAAYILMPAFIILFFLLLKLYGDHSRKKSFLGNLSSINRNEADSVSGDYSKFEPGNEYIDSDHDFSFDTDLFGKKSLFQYLNRTVTDAIFLPAGCQTRSASRIRFH
jgi:hypothetical protein